MSRLKPIRVLHVFNRMDRGGAETWIVNVMRRVDRERFRFDFLMESDKPGAYDDEIRALGGDIHIAGSPRSLPRFTRAFRRIVREHGPYDVVHSHVHHGSGVMLALASWCGVPIRIAHSHSDSRAIQQTAPLARRMYYGASRALIGRYATAGLAVSQNAATSLFAEYWERDSRWRVLHCGIDLEAFAKPVDRDALRAQFGIPADAFVVGHVGRFEPVKNHGFLIDVFAQVRQERPNARLLLIGDGPLRGEIERHVRDLSLTDAVHFAGVRPDVPTLLRGAMDTFVFPSVREGLGLAVVEAQAAGLVCAISDAVPIEAIIVPNLVQRLPHLTSREQWVETILTPPGEQHDREEHGAIDRDIIESTFNIRASVDALEQVYLGI